MSLTWQKYYLFLRYASISVFFLGWNVNFIGDCSLSHTKPM